MKKWLYRKLRAEEEPVVKKTIEEVKKVEHKKAEPKFKLKKGVK